MTLPIRIDVTVDEAAFSDRAALQRFADRMSAHAASTLAEDYGDESEHGGRMDGYEGPFVLLATPQTVALP
jgi:hypothetical protein